MKKTLFPLLLFLSANSVFSQDTIADYFPMGVGAVDLGLSVKWASCNIGAKTPYETGIYFGATNQYKQKIVGDWCLPTKNEVQELIDECTWTLTTINHMKGYKIVGKNGNCIFLPMAGSIGRKKRGTGKWGAYMVLAPVTVFNTMTTLWFDKKQKYVDTDYKYFDRPIRAVIK